MIEDLDSKSKELLSPQNAPQHVERPQKLIDAEKLKDGEAPTQEDEALDGVDQYTQIEQKSREVEAFAGVVEQQLAAKLRDYTVEGEGDELLEALSRLFGTRDRVITYPMYRTCLSIIGQQTQDFSDKVNITPEKILAAVGGNLTNAFTPEGISGFMGNSDLLKNGVMNFKDFAPLTNDTDKDKQESDVIKKLVGLMLKVIDPSGAIKKVAEAAGAEF